MESYQDNKVNFSSLRSNGWITGKAVPSGKIFKRLGVKLQYNEYQEHPNSATFDMDDTIKLIEKIPPKIAESIRRANIDIIVGDGTVTSFSQLAYLKGVQPTGWPEGSSWDTVAGLDGSPRVILGTHGLAYKNMVLHEIGHAFSHSLNDEGLDHSASSSFKELYDELDFQKLNPYYFQGGTDAGREELFASIFAHALNPIKDDGYLDDDDMYKPLLDYMHSLLRESS